MQGRLGKIVSVPMRSMETALSLYSAVQNTPEDVNEKSSYFLHLNKEHRDMLKNTTILDMLDSYSPKQDQQIFFDDLVLRVGIQDLEKTNKHEDTRSLIFELSDFDSTD